MISIARPLGELLTAPLMLAMLVFLFGLVCRWRGRSRASRWLTAAAGLIVYLGASPIVGNALAGPLERAFPPLSEQAVSSSGVGYVVVLGSGYSPRDSIPVTAALDRSGLVRVVEAIRLMRRLGIGKLVLSGGAPAGKGKPALGYAELARDLDVPNASLVILDQAQNTTQEARAVRQLLGDKAFILVTSAVHMPRAVRAMQRAGAHPIAAPTGQLVMGSALRWTDLLPSSNGLLEVEAALHEYLGLAVLRVGIG